MEEGKAPDQQQGGALAAAGALFDDSADPTVEEYLQSYCDHLVKGIEEHTEKRVAALKEELEKGKAEVRALARGEKPPSEVMYTITLLVKEGPYSDGTFTLQQTENRCEFWFGRSTGKRFKESGVSLPQDLEVSTKHGKMECRDGKVYFEDVGSTNGSSINDTALQAGRPYPLASGDLLKVGGTVFEVQLTADNDQQQKKQEGDAMEVVH